ncbi:MAG: hypothetical protein UW35_C0039G0005 [Candidatus Collierbacteria bacterium GW2011_GWF2_44_15]|uniref:Uncharacterized protein n=5 Tax=Candidatus Collieribacteriota TaxID=1752725 RepID=A0A0G1HD50_9BACT|nr:MAG: hypothetical protein UW23_C0031G0009 [Candidatus Collierbacteria bacterium GW2011_GWA1_44_12]KKT38943.1 MAG: hypothetical protein UW26_C0010G0037 [Candidatus Collierbacteria bacterium GW2011_GWF1_44_12]KKT45316.1 MAG: hypothetical protein UW35_C0039G0005 [Candidatus Collierbacteria bacterium GW2011_GWF2_44_15]KKT98668.1 MAG: hypothetical protein UW99_C0021G0005 [Candidatus Collierbacteria bacterium GW2011_GWC2_45_15]KKU30087.1 MAG: hypothetical protein UX41_C0009G0014 [Candidatus Collie
MAGRFSSKGHCLDCGARLPLFSSELFCDNCKPVEEEPQRIPYQPRTPDDDGLDINTLAMLSECDVLPKELREFTIEDMRDGEEGYIVPWTIFVDPIGRMMIPANTRVNQKSGGTCITRIRRLGSLVMVSKRTIGDYKWVPGQYGTFGASLNALMPVKLV